MGLLKEHVVVEMHVVIGPEAADGEPLGDVGPHDVGKALAGGKHLPVPGLPQKGPEPGREVRGVVVDEPLQVLRLPAAGGRHLATQVVVELAVAVKAQALAHLHDAGGGEEVLARDLLDAHPFLPPLNVGGDAGDDLALILRQQVRQ